MAVRILGDRGGRPYRFCGWCSRRPRAVARTGFAVGVPGDRGRSPVQVLRVYSSSDVINCCTCSPFPKI